MLFIKIYTVLVKPITDILNKKLCRNHVKEGIQLRCLNILIHIYKFKINFIKYIVRNL